MKVQNNNHYINFHAGLTKQMCREIASCDITKISHEFSKYSIPTDFKENKIMNQLYSTQYFTVDNNNVIDISKILFLLIGFYYIFLYI